MGLRKYQCDECKEILLVFEEEATKRLEKHPCKTKSFQALPNRISTVHSSESFMARTSMLDSVNDIHDVEEENGRKAANERELKQQNKARGGTQ